MGEEGRREKTRSMWLEHSKHQEKSLREAGERLAGPVVTGWSSCFLLSTWPVLKGLLRGCGVHCAACTVLCCRSRWLLGREWPDGSRDSVSGALLLVCSARVLVLFWFSLKCLVSRGFHSYLHLECSVKPNIFSSPLQMHSSPSVKSLKSEMGDKMKQTFNFSPRSSSVHSLYPLGVSSLKKDIG